MFTRRNLALAAGMTAAVALTAGALIAFTAEAETQSSAPVRAPVFTASDSYGATVSLADFAGKTVVLEWTNDGCPFVQKHYAVPPANMQSLQAAAAEEGVVWLTVISSAAGKQGYQDGDGANALTASRGAAPAHVLLDSEGDLGRLYGAKTTPHMYIVAPNGTLVYNGAIDSNPSAKVADIAGATNYVAAALAQIQAGEQVTIQRSKPYGCSIKY